MAKELPASDYELPRLHAHNPAMDRGLANAWMPGEAHGIPRIVLKRYSHNGIFTKV